jgi:hypothetical protein
MVLLNWIDKNLFEINKNQYFLTLFDSTEIQFIEDKGYLFNSIKGINTVISNKNVIQSIHLFSGKDLKNCRFKDELPNDLNFEMDIKSVLELLGFPNRNGGGYKDIFGEVPLWNKYYFDGYVLHIQYTSFDKSIDMVTISSKYLEPYLNSNLQ